MTATFGRGGGGGGHGGGGGRGGGFSRGRGVGGGGWGWWGGWCDPYGYCPSYYPYQFGQDDEPYGQTTSAIAIPALAPTAPPPESFLDEALSVGQKAAPLVEGVAKVLPFFLGEFDMFDAEQHRRHGHHQHRGHEKKKPHHEYRERPKAHHEAHQYEPHHHSAHGKAITSSGNGEEGEQEEGKEPLPWVPPIDPEKDFDEEYGENDFTNTSTLPGLYMPKFG